MTSTRSPDHVTDGPERMTTRHHAASPTRPRTFARAIACGAVGWLAGLVGCTAVTPNLPGHGTSGSQADVAYRGAFNAPSEASAPTEAATKTVPGGGQRSLAPPRTRLVSDRRYFSGDATSAAQMPAESPGAGQPPDENPYVARQFPDNFGAGGFGGSAPAASNPPGIGGAGPITNVPPPGGIPSTPPGLTGNDVLPQPAAPTVGPTAREANLVINGYPARTGRIMFGGAVNSDAGVTGQITVDERNFDIMRWPTSFQDLFSGTAFRGAGQTLRIEAVPGSQFDRYTFQFADPNLLGYLPISMSVSGFLFDRRFNDWDEERLGGRLSLGYRVTPDLSLSVGVSGQNVEITNPRIIGVPPLDDVLGDNELYSGEVSLTHDTRDSPIQASRGHYFEFSFEEVFGTYDYARFETEYRTYFLLAQRADGSGKQTLSYSTQVGFSGEDTPIFENFFAGGYATLRGFDFRGASPVLAGVEVGGRFQWLNSVEYMFPITADDAFRGVAFVDFGTVERDVELNEDNYRVVPGVGLRVAIPMLGPAPLAFDFGFPVAQADTDDERMFSFYMSLVR